MPFPRPFYFLRHGETDWNRDGLMQGWVDIPLNETGRAQARDAVPLLEALPVGLIVASPLARAHETALIINETLKKPLLLEPGLRERHFGALEGTRWHDLLGQGGKGGDDPHALFEGPGAPCPEGAEDYATFTGRVVRAVAARMAAAPGEGILFVAHGGVCRVLGHALTGGARRTANARPYLFEKGTDGWVQREVGG
jgi:broad specificity phosphatase PhoE